MGKPFKKELSVIDSTVLWAVNQEPTRLRNLLLDFSRNPLYIVGSGGSLSACWFAASLYQRNGGFAKAVTPLDLFYIKESIREANLLFISASGKNTDILFGFNIAIQHSPNKIITMSMAEESPLANLANSYTLSQSVNYSIPSKKDGFLATNSLIGYYVLLCQAFGFSVPPEISKIIAQSYFQELHGFISQLSSEHTLIVLYGGWGQSVACDIESKFTEAALGNIIMSDYRNFGHGRHHWFAKRNEKSAILALVTPEEEMIAEKTLNLLPNNIPKFKITSSLPNPASAIELLIKSFYLVNAFGELQGIDPGRPGVPDFGSKLYHLKYANFYLKKIPDEIQAILQKTAKSDLLQFTDEELNFWKEKYIRFKKKLSSSKFSSIVFDYDGTLCSDEEKKTGPSEAIIVHLIGLLKSGILVGIASGRGKSIREDLRRLIPKQYWNQLIIGYYNGAEIGYLDNELIPNLNLPNNEGLKRIEAQLIQIDYLNRNATLTLRPYQLTIEPISGQDDGFIKKYLQNIVMQEEEFQFLESSHSIDIVVKKQASKLNIVNYCHLQAEHKEISGECLVIGDKGQWPGNDFSMLATPYSLSVDEVSVDPDSCWNLAPIGQRNTLATIHYLSKISITNQSFTIHL